MEHQSGAALYQEHLNTAMEQLRSDWSAEDLRAALRPDVLANAQLLERSLRNGEGDIRGWLVLGWVYFYRIRAQGSPASREDWIAAATAFAPCFIAEVEPLPEILLPTIVDLAANRAVALLREVDLSTVREVVRLWRRIGAATAPDDSQRPRRLSQLSVALQQQFDLFGVPSDREAAFAFAEDALRSTPADQSPPAEILYNAGSLLWSRYGLTLEPGDLDQALDYMRRAVSAGLPDAPHTGEALITLALAHLARCQLGTDPADLDRSISVLEKAVEACPAAGTGRRDALGLLSHSLLVRFKTAGVRADLTASMVTVRQAVDEAVRSDTLTPALPSRLGEALLVAFGCYGNPKDLDEAIDRHREAVRLADPEDPARAVYLVGLGVAHRTRFDQFGNPEDLDQAIVHGRSAVEAAAADTDLLRGSLGSLGHALQSRFEAGGAQQDIDDAVDILGRALTITPIGLADRPDALSNYGGALHARFRLNAGPADLEGAIEVLQEAVEVAPARHVDRATYLSNLCIALSSRFRSAGAITDLEAAVAFGEQAVEVTPAGHPGRPGYLSNVTLALGDRFRRSGALADLDAAISYGTEAVAATSQDNPDRAMYLANLGGTLQTRFWRTGAESDLDAAIDAHAEALRLTPPDRPDQGLLLSSYAMSLATRYERTGDARDVDHAVKLLRRAVDITPVGHPERGGFISNLGGALRSRFTVTRSRHDLEAAVETGRQAVAACREDQPDRTAALANLGVSLEAMFVETGRGREEAVGAFEAASKFTSGAPSTRIRAARSAAALLARSDPARGAELLADAVELLPTVAERWLRRNDKQRELGGVSGLAGDAAALMLSVAGSEPLARPTFERALIVLESGRTVLLGQALENRTDLMDLRAVHPHLAERFTRLTDLLDSDLSAPVMEAVQAPARTGAMQTAQQLGRHRAALDLAELIDRIRSLHGFTDFVRQPTAEDLIGEARPGPVVVFNVSRYGSDALAVREDGVSRIRLGELDVKSLATRIREFDTALSTAGDPRAARAARIQAQRDVSAVLEWLWDVVAEPVLSALGLDAPPSPDAPMPRVWWIPGGVLGLLPLHAAGYHRDASVGQGGRTVPRRAYVRCGTRGGRPEAFLPLTVDH